MVDYTSQYAPILERAVRIYTDLIELYAPDRAANSSFVDATINDASAARRGLLERLAKPDSLARTFTSNYFLSITHFLDNHWDDYREYPIADPEKFKQREELHKELKAVKNDIMRIQYTLRQVAK